MAWTAPATWSVAEVVTAAKMNTHVRDNLKYLKGQAGAVAIEDAVTIGVNTNAANGLTITNSNANSSAFANLYMVNDGGSIGGLLRNSTTNTGYAGVNSISLMTFAAHGLGLGTNNSIRQYIDSTGNVGFGTLVPQGKIHAVGAGGSLMFLSATAVAGSVVTLAAAGTVAAAAGFVAIFDYCNTGGASNIFTTIGRIPVGSSNTYTAANGDVITVAVTAGGAITVQRTTGSASTHEIAMLVLSK